MNKARMPAMREKRIDISSYTQIEKKERLMLFTIKFKNTDISQHYFSIINTF
jgi:hypothetical protein